MRKVRRSVSKTRRSRKRSLKKSRKKRSRKRSLGRSRRTSRRSRKPNGRKLKYRVENLSKPCIPQQHTMGESIKDFFHALGRRVKRKMRNMSTNMDTKNKRDILREYLQFAQIQSYVISPSNIGVLQGKVKSLVAEIGENKLFHGFDAATLISFIYEEARRNPNQKWLPQTINTLLMLILPLMCENQNKMVCEVTKEITSKKSLKK